MKGLKMYLAAIGVAAATSADAAQVLYNDVTGNLVSYSATIPSAGTVNATFDPVTPDLDGYLFVDIDLSNPKVTGYLNLEYTNINLGSGTTKTIPMSTVNISGGTATSSFDPVTGRLIKQVSGDFMQRDSFCIGAAAICGPLYTEGNERTDYLFGWPWMRGSFTGTLDLTFNAARNAFTGTLTETDTLASGAVITKVYSLNGQLPPPIVPVPFAGVLFGSGLLALGGIARRRNRAR